LTNLQEEGIELVLLDINMPVMNGLQFLQNIQNDGNHKGLPIIIVSTRGRKRIH
jgi:two-component system chemotaxis response regulator CheY